MAFEYGKVLIVDDEALIRQGIKHFINWEQEGFQIVGEAANGKEALELIAELRPHIVLTDIVMPIMDGEELTRRIKLEYPDIEVIVLSSFGEFDYVRSTFQSGVRDYILKPKLDIGHLLTVLKETADKIPSLRAQQGEAEQGQPIEALLEKLLSGFEIDDEQRSELADEFPHRCFCLVGIDLRGRAVSKQQASGLQQSMQDEIQNRTSSAANVVFRFLRTESNVLAMLFNMDHNGLSSLPGWARAMTGVLAEHEVNAAVSVGEPFTELNELAVNYKESLLKLMDYAFFFPGKRLLIYNELPLAEQDAAPFNLNYFTEEFKRERFEAVFRYLEEHVQELTVNYKTDVFEFKSFLGNLIFNMTVLLGNMKYGTQQLESKKYYYFKAIEESLHADEAQSLLDEFIKEAKQCIEEKSEQSGNANMKRLLDYIDEHYAEPLNLTEMAKHFHFNPSYLSSYFSTHHNEGFVDYLHRVRTDKASELLRAGEASISEISGMVGYSDHSYFCKVFKKHTGLSPSRYRQQTMK
ncbi:response regulator transcription factor [Paenibacillus sp. NEAU-GSW1]|uniref:response regulator transcription factor n=1 Tax=Paenibacillus sp. NEAU-GSW1 TaxID=2682486 RepID=UPI0012E24710|nr:response regulator transcription factor [Paenibacillus sp. NEAU-GSW1]MUT65201.1 response regulator [Paenibacillus sp. NEAU-GSW1]